MLREPNALWVQVLKHKYFPLCEPLPGKVSINGSWTWKGLLEGLEIVKRNYSWELANGNKVHIWADIWVQLILINLCLPI